MESNAVSSSEGPIGPVFGPSNDIHNELNYGNIDSFENSSIQSVKSSLSNGVMPLHYYTNEYQVSHSGFSEVPNFGTFAHDVGSSLPAETCSGTNLCELKDLQGMYILFIFYITSFYFFNSLLIQVILFMLWWTFLSQTRALMVVISAMCLHCDSVSRDSQHPLLFNSTKCSADGYVSNERVSSVICTEIIYVYFFLVILSIIL